MVWLLFAFGDSDGGDGFAVYSVSAKPVFFGVRGDAMPLTFPSGVTGRE
jgi:hypothetical protein